MYKSSFLTWDQTPKVVGVADPGILLASSSHYRDPQLLSFLWGIARGYHYILSTQLCTISIYEALSISIQIY